MSVNQEVMEMWTEFLNDYQYPTLPIVSPKSIDNIARDIKQYAQANNISIENVFYCLHLMCGGEKL